METFNGITEAQLTLWVAAQRTRYRHGLLAPEFIADCESIPGWKWDYLRAPSTFLPFETAKLFVHSLGFNSQIEWFAYCKSGKRPTNIPYGPNVTYKERWVNWGDWLGTGNVHKKSFLSFEEARAFVRSLNLKNHLEWVAYCHSGKRPSNIPSSPRTQYQNNGWVSFGDWLGSGIVSDWKKKFLPFVEARAFARSLKLKNGAAWRAYCKANPPNDVPANARRFYSGKGWVSTGDWLGYRNRQGEHHE